LIDNAATGRFSAPPRRSPPGGASEGAQAVRARILEVLDSIRPAIQADGGDVEFLSFREDKGVVEVKLLGACDTCPISMMTLKEGIERRLKSSVPGVQEVIAI
jgi:Fe-S cluster biogenesis protein NfuA